MLRNGRTKDHRQGSASKAGASGGLGEQNDQLHLRVQNFGGGVDGEVAGALHRLPHRAAGFNGEVLVAQFYGNRARRRGDVLQAQTGQGIANEGFKLRGGAGLEEFRSAVDRVRVADIG